MIGRDIIITVPKTISWQDYSKELEAVKDGSHVMNFRLSAMPNVKPGNRCYVVHNGEIKGWMKIVGTKKGPFKCTTTGVEWPEGNYVERSGVFHYITPIEMKGFQGFRYYNHNL